MSFAAAKQLVTPPRVSRYHMVGRIPSYPMRSTRYHLRTLPPPNFYIGDPTTLGALDFSVKSVFKSIKKVGRVVLRVVPGAVGGFVTGGPVGAVVGAAVSYETVRRKTSGLGSGIRVGGLLKGTAYGVGIGAVTGVVTTTIVGAATKIAPTYMTTGGLLASSGGTTSGLLTTGLLPGVSATAFSAGAGAVGAIGTIGKTLLTTAGTLFASKPSIPQAQEQSEQEIFYQDLYKPIGEGAPSQPQPSYLTDAYIQSGGGEPTSVSSGYQSPGFAPSEEQVEAIKQAGLFGIPWTYIGVGVGGILAIYLLSQPKRKMV